MEFWLGTLVLMGFPMKGRAGCCLTSAVAAGIATTSDGARRAQPITSDESSEHTVNAI